MSEINKRIEALEAELQKLKNEVKEPKVKEFELNKWYKFYDTNETLLVWNSGNETYGFWNGTFKNNWSFGTDCLNDKNVIPATHQEVEEALIKEAKKRGFKEGVSFKTVERKSIAKSYTTKFKYYRMNVCIYPNETVLLNNGDGCIFCNGVWAEIVKDEPIVINGYKVEKVDNNFNIGCKQITRKELNHIKGFMERNNYVNVKFSSENNAHLVCLETINKILAL